MADEIIHDGRDEKGRFVVGNPGGPGRPPRVREQAFLDELKAAFPPEVLAAKLKRAMEIAEKQNSVRGMVAVAEAVMAYTIGKPAQAITVSNNAADVLADMLRNRSAPVLPPRSGEVLPGPSRLLEED